MAPIVALILRHGKRDEGVRLAAVSPVGREESILVGATVIEVVSGKVFEEIRRDLDRHRPRPLPLPRASSRGGRCVRVALLRVCPFERFSVYAASPAHELV